LGRAIDAAPFKQKLFLLGDFNARVGRKNHDLWHKVLDRHGIGNENANGSMLLDLCTKQRLVITNTVFQQANKLKASWILSNRSFQTVHVCKTEFWVIKQNRKYFGFHFRLGDPTDHNFRPGKLPEEYYIRTGTETSRLL